MMASLADLLRESTNMGHPPIDHMIKPDARRLARRYLECGQRWK